MPSRRRVSGNPVSLFAFQDIITSVTAIMILMVLILTLEFVTRARTAGVVEDHRRVATDLAASVRAAEERVKSLQQELAGARAAARNATAESAESLRRRLATAQATQAGLERDLARAVEAEARAATERRTAEDRLLAMQAKAADAAGLEAERAAAAAAARALESANDAERERQRAVDSGATQPTRLLFNPSADGGKVAVIVELAAEGVTVLPPGGGDRQPLGWGLTGPSFAFTRWLAGRRRGGEYIVIMLRPSGIDRYDAVRKAIVAAGIDVGTELVPEDLAIVVGDDGGGP